MKKILLIFCLISFAHAAEDRDGFWFGTFTNKQLNDDYSYWAEAQLRYDLDVGRTRQFLYRTGVIKKITENQSMAVLYAYIQSLGSKEHRWALQHVAKYGKWLGLDYSHRMRYEYRNLEDFGEDATRFRYLLRSEQNTDGKFDLVIWNELFVNLQERSWNGDQAIDRNRVFLGFKHKAFENNRVEFGYLNQYVPRDGGDISEHLLVGYLFF